MSLLPDLKIARKWLMEGLPSNLAYLEEPFYICPFTKTTKIIIGPTTDVSKFPPDFMLHIDFTFLNVDSIRGFTLNFVAIWYATSYPFGFPSRSKSPPLDILKFPVATLKNQDKKVAFIRFNEYGALARSYEFMKTCHKMNIIFQNTGGYASSLNGKSEIPNKTLADIKIVPILNSIQNK